MNNRLIDELEAKPLEVLAQELGFVESQKMQELRNKISVRLKKGLEDNDATRKLAISYQKETDATVAQNNGEERDKSEIGQLLMISLMQRDSNNLEQFNEDLYDAAIQAREKGIEEWDQILLLISSEWWEQKRQEIMGMRPNREKFMQGRLDYLVQTEFLTIRQRDLILDEKVHTPGKMFAQIMKEMGVSTKVVKIVKDMEDKLHRGSTDISERLAEVLGI